MSSPEVDTQALFRHVEAITERTGLTQVYNTAWLSPGQRASLETIDEEMRALQVELAEQHNRPAPKMRRAPTAQVETYDVFTTAANARTTVMKDVRDLVTSYYIHIQDENGHDVDSLSLEKDPVTQIVVAKYQNLAAIEQARQAHIARSRLGPEDAEFDAIVSAIPDDDATLTDLDMRLNSDHHYKSSPEEVALQEDGAVTQARLARILPHLELLPTAPRETGTRLL